ncbi:carbohydrate ABC transporter permease [Bacillus weihaiensis]|uniref:ABC transporter permease n=1 Tax=Bacillus weihaiensis TaxID=1547283 RepID=A0A1L3MNL5_9BACI|nr:carbohydrate ABC transporter permease [Bacillus weihaiensis]APH03939.1 ABC transporter permease [Bacillus weihaiensis]
MKKNDSIFSKLFDLFNIIFLGLLSLSMILPLISVIAKSFSSSEAISKGEVFFWPIEFTTMNYEYVFQDASIWRAFFISILITVGGTFINLLATTSLAYPLSRPEYKGKKVILFLVLFTMIFSAPLIPSYLVVKNLGMVDTLWALVIPSMISAFNFFVMRSFFQNIPSTLIDAARIDGLGELGILFRVVLPLSKPVLATIGLFYGVSHWNNYQSALYFINDPKLYPLQVKLRQMIVNDEMAVEANTVFSSMALNSPEGIQMATVVVAIIPILLLYPFLQKYFVKGSLIGSIKE